jgi:small subunit ribosomal protein S9
LNEDSDEPDIKNRKKKKDTKSNKKEKEFSKDFTYSPFFPYPMHEMMQSKAKRRRRTAIENAAKVAYENLKARAKPVFKIFSPRDYLLKGDLDHSLKMKKGFVPSFAEIIAEAEKFILNNPVLEKLNKQDEYEKNMHFVPKYLDKNLTPENYLFSFMPKVEDAVYPGYITEQYPLREDDHVLVELHDQAESIRSKGYVPDPKDMSLKVYSLVKNDPYHMHFLNNHIKFWNECIRETVESQNFEKEIRAKPAIPWEYIDVPQVPIIRPVRDRKVAPDSEGYISAPGKRKRSYAVASIRPGTGIISINGKNLLAYCPDHVSRERIVRPFTVTRLTGMYDVKARVRGGGVMGQSQAVQLAVARVIAKIHPDANPILHDSEVMRRDPRQVERKKTSKFKARKSYTYVKR